MGDYRYSKWHTTAPGGLVEVTTEPIPGSDYHKLWIKHNGKTWGPLPAYKGGWGWWYIDTSNNRHPGYPIPAGKGAANYNEGSMTFSAPGNSQDLAIDYWIELTPGPPDLGPPGYVEEIPYLLWVKVYGEEPGQFLPGADVTTPWGSGKTDMNGDIRFNITSPTSGTVTAAASGYISQSKSITLKLGDNTLDFTLLKEGVPEEPPEEPPVEPPIEPSVTPKKYVVQYWSEDDKPYAEDVAQVVDGLVVKAGSHETIAEATTPSIKNWILVGAQEANPVFREIVEGNIGIRNVTDDDKGYVFIQVATSPFGPFNIWAVAGATEADTAKSASFIRDEGLPTRPVRRAWITLTPMQREWKDYFDNPDIIKALGVTIGAVQNSISKVFSGVSVLTGKEETPTLEDYSVVGLTIAGLAASALASVITSIAVLPSVGTGAMMKGMVRVAESTGKVIPLSAVEAAIESSVIKPVLVKSIAGWVTSHLSLKTLVGAAAFLIGTDTFVDFIGEEAVQTAGMGVWTLISAKDWEGAKVALEHYRVFIGHLKAKVDLVGPLNPISYGAFKNYYEAAETQAAAYEKTINQNLGVLAEDFPEVIRATVRGIIDGDTIDVGLDAFNNETDEPIKLPEYSTTGHARIRLLGINCPEKSPKGEITCSDVDIFKVEKTYADQARDVLLPLNDKEVILKVDHLNPVGTQGRILALVEYNGVNINLRQIKDGLACGYYREDNKYVDKPLYISETLAAKDSKIGMWGGLVEGPDAGPKFTIKIDSIPTNASLFIDGTDAHHRTPSDETELSDVMDLLRPGEHTLKVTKSGKVGEQIVNIIEGSNPDIIITLVSPGAEMPPPVEPIPGEPTIEPPVEEIFTINIDSSPTRARLYIDGTYTHHLTPSNAPELADVMAMLAPGLHTFKVTKSGMEGSIEAMVLAGTNPDIMITLAYPGLPSGEPEEPPEELPDFKFNILSTPSRAKIFIDDQYIFHLTPSNEVELKDVMHLLTPGQHNIRVERSGKSANVDVDVVAGYNEPIFLTLEVVGLTRTPEEIEAEITSLEASIEALRAELAAL